MYRIGWNRQYVAELKRQHNYERKSEHFGRIKYGVIHEIANEWTYKWMNEQMK